MLEHLKSKRHQPVPESDHGEEEEVDQAGERRAKRVPGWLDEGCLEAGDNVDKAVEDDQTVEARSLLPQDADARPYVDHKGDQCEGNIGKKINLRLCQVHLHRGLWSHFQEGLFNTRLLAKKWINIEELCFPPKDINPILTLSISKIHFSSVLSNQNGIS